MNDLLLKKLNIPSKGVRHLKQDIISSYERESKWSKIAKDENFWKPFIQAEQEYKDLGTEFYQIDINRGVCKSAADHFFSHKIDSFRKETMEVFKSRRMCVICGQTSVAQIDHVLPRSKFPDLTLVPINLIPICAQCNGAKLENWGNLDTPIYNQYLDDVDINTKDFIFSFSSEKDSFAIQLEYIGNDRRLAYNIFDIYKLDTVLKADAIDLLRTLVQTLSESSNIENVEMLTREIHFYATYALEQKSYGVSYPEASEIFFNSLKINGEAIAENWDVIADTLR